MNEFFINTRLNNPINLKITNILWNARASGEKELLPEGWNHERLTLEIIRSEKMEFIFSPLFYLKYKITATSVESTLQCN